MTAPIQEPSTERALQGFAYARDQIFRRPSPAAPTAGMLPWVALYNGATTAADNTWMPVPFADLAYDPDLVTPGDVFSWNITDTGDPGNDRFELRTHVSGWYRFELVTTWDQVTTGGTDEHGYAVQELQFAPTLNSPFFENTFLSSADWLDFDLHVHFEMVDNPTLMTGRTIYVETTSTDWRPRARQATGVTRGLSGLMLLVEFIGPDTDYPGWTFETV